MSDPFTIVGKAIADVVLASPLVNLALKNVKDFTEQRLPILDRVSESDLPEVQVQAATMNVNPFFSSCSVEVVRTYTIMLSTGEQRLDIGLYPLEWAVTVAIMAAYLDGTFQALTYNSAKFITSIESTQSTNGLSDPNANRGIKGWSALHSVDVTMQFGRVAVKALNTGV